MAFSKNPLSRSINVNTTNTTSRSGTVASYNSEMNPATAAAEIEMEHRKLQHAPPQSATAAASSLQSSSVPTSPLQIPLHYQFEGPGDGDGDGGKTAMETYRGIWYTRTRLEEQFLVKSFLETRFRYLILEAITLVALVGLISTATNPGVVAFLTASMVYSPIAIIADAIVVGLSFSEKWKPKRVLFARVHEILSFVLVLYMVTFHGLYIRSRTEICIFTKHHDPNAVDNEDCPQLYLWSLFFLLTPLLIAQPRFFLTVITLIYSAVFAFFHLRFHGVSFVGTVTLTIIYIAHLLFIGAMKWIFESQHRRRFEAEVSLRKRLENIRFYNNSLNQFVTQFTPQHLRSRLTGTTIQVDVATQALAVASRIHDSAKHINSMLPSQAAKTIALYTHVCETDSIKYGLHHIRTVGDTNYFVANLFKEDHVSIPDAALSAVKFATMSNASSTGFGVCTGIAAGSMTGLPVGTTCIRYDIFGAAMTEAQSLALSCPPNMVRLQSSLLEEVSEHIVVVDAELGIAHGRDPINETSPFMTIQQQGGSDSPSDPQILIGSTASILSDTLRSSQPPEVVQIDDRSLSSFDFTVRNTCFIFSNFAAEATRNAASQHNRHSLRSMFVFYNCFFAFQALVTVISVVEERHRNIDTGMEVFFAMMGVSFVGFLLLAAVTLRAIMKNTEHQSWHIWIFMACCLVVLTGNNFSRPSALGDSNSHLIWSVLFCILFIGASVQQMLGFQLLATACYYVAAVAYRPVFIQMMIIVFVGTLIFAALAVQHNRLQIYLFTDMVKSNEALSEEAELCAVRETVQNSLIPLAVRDKGMLAENLGSNYVRTWSNDSCIVITVRAYQDDSIIAGLVDKPEALRNYAESVTRIVEDLTPTLKHESLSIIKVFGGVMTIAGPLFSDSSNIVQATQDTFELLERLHDLTTSGQSGSGFAVAVAIEQVVNVLRLTEFPSYELMGPAVNMSRAMANACPAPMTVVVEKLTQMYTRECISSPAVRISDGESWRLRDLGVARVCHVRFPQQHTTTSVVEDIAE